jgi:phage FluMu protein gp41
MALRTGEHQERGLSMTEQVPEDLTDAEVADRREADRAEDEGDTASEVDRWDDEGGHDRVG